MFYYSRDRRGEHPQAYLAGYAGITFGLPVQRLVLAELLEQHHRSKLGPAQPRAMTWNGAGTWLIFSQYGS
ncbi:hypothetical protein XH81_04770 [Bradyrhizobium sp. CCBAU 25360]|nr:hypothetical protein [Bradyrhizobium sp. CCBAU 25360]